jgi:hypothetical protein
VINKSRQRNLVLLKEFYFPVISQRRAQKSRGKIQLKPTKWGTESKEKRKANLIYRIFCSSIIRSTKVGRTSGSSSQHLSLKFEVKGKQYLCIKLAKLKSRKSKEGRLPPKIKSRNPSKSWLSK